MLFQSVVELDVCPIHCENLKCHESTISNNMQYKITTIITFLIRHVQNCPYVSELSIVEILLQTKPLLITLLENFLGLFHKFHINIAIVLKKNNTSKY